MIIHEIFSHIDTDGTLRKFSINLLKESFEKNPDDWETITMSIDKKRAKYVMEKNGVELPRVLSYPRSKINFPGIGCLWQDNSMLIVDGNHRLVKRICLKLKTMDFNVCQETIWEQCLV